MAYAPIAGVIPQYDEQYSWWLKFYQPNTTTPIAMATDGTGGTTLAKCQLDVDGFPTTDGTTLFIPYLDQLYDAYLFPTEAQADANATAEGKRIAQNINPFDENFNLNITKTLISYNPGDDAINLGATPVGINLIIDGDVQKEGATLDANSSYTYNPSTGIINLKTPLTGNEIVEVQYGAIFTISDPTITFVTKDLVRDYGAKGDAVYSYLPDGTLVVSSGTDDTQAMLDALADIAGGAINAITVPEGNFWMDSSQIDLPSNTCIIGTGTQATKFIKSTTTDTLNMFIGYYNGGRVSNITLSNLSMIGDKRKDNAIGSTCFRTFGTQNVVLSNIRVEGSKGMWFGEDNASLADANLYGTQNVFASDIYIDGGTLFSFYIRGVEVPAAGFDEANETSNFNISNLIIKNSNVGLVTAEGNPKNIKVNNYDSQYNDNLLQIEKTDNIHINNIHMSNGTNVWPAVSPTPYKQQWLISASNNVTIENGYIDSELQAFAFGVSNNACKTVLFNNIATGDLWRCTTLNVQNGTDTNKNLFSNWSWSNCYFPRDATTFFQSDVADQGGFPLAYWRDWDFDGCTWENGSTSNPINSIACVGSFNFSGTCNFNGKSPRSLKGQKIRFDATVRSNGIPNSDILFTAVDDVSAGDQKILRIGGNIQIEGEVTDTGFDVVHDNGSYDSRSAGDYCRITDATNFYDEGLSATGFNVARLSQSGVVTFKSLSYPKSSTGSPVGSITPDYKGQHYIDTSGSPTIWYAYGLLNTEWVQLN